MAHEAHEAHERNTGAWRVVLRLLPALAFLATFGVFFVDKYRSAKTVFGSGRGLLTIAVIVGGYVLIAFGLRRLVRWEWAPPIVLTVVVLALAAWIVRPYYVDETANRELVAGTVVDLPDEPETTAGENTDTPKETSAPTAAAGPVRVARGELVGIGHDASGVASLVRAPDGTVVVRFEDFDIEGVPDPVVYLVDGPDVRDPGGIDLGGLPGNQGDLLDFALPASARDTGPGWTVLVWCRAFAVPVANATLT